MAVTGNPLDTFTDLMAATPASRATGIDELTFWLPEKSWFLHAMTAHGALNKRFFAGVEIRDTFVDEVPQTGNYRRPNGEFSFSLPQVFKEWVSYPSLFLDYVAWTQFEMVQNGIVRDLRGPALRERIKKLRDTKLKMQKVNQARQFEADLLDVPNYTTMENPSTFHKPRSLFCYVNEGVLTDFSTLQGIDPTVVTEFTCERVGADYTSGIGTPAWAGFQGLDILTANVMRDPIPFLNEDQVPRAPAQHELLATTWGYALFQSQVRASNDFLRMAGSDPGVRGAHFDGIPLRRVTSLNHAEVWTNAGGTYPTGGSEQTSAVKGPRFILMDYAAYEPRFHAEMKFYRHSVREHPRVVGTMVMPIETWWTALSTDPRSLGVMYPTVTMTVPAGV